MTAKNKRIRLHEETDAEMASDADSTWVGVDDFSVYIKRTDEGVVVDIYARGLEDCNSLSSCYALHEDVEELKEEQDLEVD
jgi:hypothetical protein